MRSLTVNRKVMMKAIAAASTQGLENIVFGKEQWKNHPDSSSTILKLVRQFSEVLQEAMKEMVVFALSRTSHAGDLKCA